MRALLFFIGSLVLFGGCRAAVDLERPRAYPCSRDGGADQCRGGWVCGFEGVCVDPAVSETRRCQRDQDCGAWHCGPRDDAGLGECYDVSVPAPVACTVTPPTRVSPDCAPGWLCGLDGRCVEADAGTERPCDESLPCGGGYACSRLGADTDSRRCVPFAAEAPVDAGAFIAPELFSPTVQVAAQHNAVSFWRDLSLAAVTPDGGLWVASTELADGGRGLFRARATSLSGVSQVSRVDEYSFIALTGGNLVWVGTDGGVRGQVPVPVPDVMLVDGVKRDEVWVLGSSRFWSWSDGGLIEHAPPPAPARLAHVMQLFGTKLELVIATSRGLYVFRNDAWVPMAIDDPAYGLQNADCDGGGAYPPSAVLMLTDDGVHLDTPRGTIDTNLSDLASSCSLEVSSWNQLCDFGLRAQVGFPFDCLLPDGGLVDGGAPPAFSQLSRPDDNASRTWVISDGRLEFVGGPPSPVRLAGNRERLAWTRFESVTALGGFGRTNALCRGVSGDDDRVLASVDGNVNGVTTEVALSDLEGDFGLRLQNSENLGDCEVITASTTVVDRLGTRRSLVAASDRLWAVSGGGNAYDPTVRLSPVPFGRLTSVAASAAPAPLLLEGWLLDSGRLFRFSAANEVQWPTQELVLDPGLVVPPLAVWQTQGRFRVTMGDGSTYSLPGFVSIGDPAPSALFELEGFCGTAWALGYDALYRLEGRTWVEVPVPAAVPRRGPMPFAAASLHRSSRELFVVDDRHNVAVIACPTP